MNKYLEAIGELAEDSLSFTIVTAVVGLVVIVLVATLVVSLLILTKGVPLLFAIVWWVHLVDKKADKE